MSKIEMKLLAILLIVAVGLILAIIVSVEPAPVTPPCAMVSDVFVDLDRDGDEDLLIDGCAIFNAGQLITGPIPTPQVFPSGE